jgi:serine phosphatase RsbU (regulator of sigma subunit)
VAKNPANDLKVHRRPAPRIRRPGIDSLGSLGEVLQAFRATTGWDLKYLANQHPHGTAGRWCAPIRAGGNTLGHLLLAPSASPSRAGETPRLPSKPFADTAARQLASAVGGMVNELVESRYALWQREAELAAGVPTVPHSEEQAHLASRLQAVIKGGAEAIGCDAAALYLLDEATTQLKLRSCWGLPLDRLVAPPRSLKGAVADLEALLGHAVALEDTASMPQWQPPEDFASAVCVPVSTPTTLLGTLWTFCNRKRDFATHETNLLEIVAGRVASDLEREMLLGESLAAAQLKRDVAAAERLQRNQLPTLSPMLDGWQLAGWASQAGGVGGAFYDWFCQPGGLVAVALGRALDGGIAAALTAANLRAAFRAHGQYHRDPRETLTQANLSLWTGSAGDQQASGAFALLETATGELRCAAGGQIGMLHVRPGDWQHVGQCAVRLGEGPETDYRQFSQTLEPGDTMIFYTASLAQAKNAQGRLFGDAGLGEAIAANSALSADALVELLTNLLLAHTADQDSDRALMVVRRVPT